MSDISRAIERAPYVLPPRIAELVVLELWGEEAFRDEFGSDAEEYSEIAAEVLALPNPAAEVLALPDPSERRERVARALAAQWFSVEWDEMHPYDRDDMYGMADAAIAAMRGEA